MGKPPTIKESPSTATAESMKESTPIIKKKDKAANYTPMGICMSETSIKTKNMAGAPSSGSTTATAMPPKTNTKR